MMGDFATILDSRDKQLPGMLGSCRDVFPRFTSDYLPNSTGDHSVFVRLSLREDIGVNGVSFPQTLDLQYNLGSQFGIRYLFSLMTVILSKIVGAVNRPVSGVFLRGSPSKILQSIIRTVSVQVPTLLPLWFRANKCLQNQVVNVGGASAKNYKQVARSGSPRTQQFAKYSTGLAASCIANTGKGSNSSLIGNFKESIAPNDSFPDFKHRDQFPFKRGPRGFRIFFPFIINSLSGLRKGNP